MKKYVMPKGKKNCCMFNKYVCVLNHVRLIVMPWTAAPQAPLSRVFSW